MIEMNEMDHPIFVLSCARSGSTLLRWILDTHPDIYAPPELNLGRLAGDLSSSLTGLSGKRGSTLPQDLPPEVLSEIRHVFSGLLDARTRARGKKAWCEKSPLNVMHRELLSRLYPEARFVCLHRHPKDVAHSCLENFRQGVIMGVVADYVRSTPHDLERALASYWADVTEALLDCERELPGQTFRIRYEDVVARPAETLEGLFKFLGREWDPGLLAAVFKTPHDPGSGDVTIQFTGHLRRDSVGAGRRLPFALGGELAGKVTRFRAELGYEAQPPVLDSAPAPAKPPADRQEAATGLRWLFETHLPARLSAHRDRWPRLRASYHFVTGGDTGERWGLEIREDGFQVTPDGEGATKVWIRGADLLGIIQGELNLVNALRQGKIRTEGEVPRTDALQELVQILRTDL